MRLISNDERLVTVEMTQDQALTLVALIRETCFGTVMHGFETRIGQTPKQVGEVGADLKSILDEAGVTE